MSTYKTKLNPPPANGWTPPPLPPLEVLIHSNDLSQGSPPVKRNRKKESDSQINEGPNILQRRMLNLFEEAPATLFDEIDSEPSKDSEVPK